MEIRHSNCARPISHNKEFKGYAVKLLALSLHQKRLNIALMSSSCPTIFWIYTVEFVKSELNFIFNIFTHPTPPLYKMNEITFDAVSFFDSI